MARVLHLLKGADADLARVTIAREHAAGDEVVVALLHGAPAPPLPDGVAVHRVPEEWSYDRLLEAIFESDRVVAW